MRLPDAVAEVKGNQHLVVYTCWYVVPIIKLRALFFLYLLRRVSLYLTVVVVSRSSSSSDDS